MIRKASTFDWKSPHRPLHNREKKRTLSPDNTEWLDKLEKKMDLAKEIIRENELEMQILYLKEQLSKRKIEEAPI
jgi:hypothetical protein